MHATCMVSFRTATFSKQLSTTETFINTYWALFLLLIIKTGHSTVSTLCVDHYCDLHPYFPNNWNESSSYVSQSCPAMISNIQKSLHNAYVDAEYHRKHSALNLLCLVAGFLLSRWRWGNGFDCKSPEVILQHIHTLVGGIIKWYEGTAI